MSYYKRSGQMDLTDRVAIETGLCRGESFAEIAKRIHRHHSTVAREVLENRTHIHAAYFHGIDCRRAKSCNKKGLCGAATDVCHKPCTLCRTYDCRILCSTYESMACHNPDSPPYVCNTCRDRRLCIKDKYIYSAMHADAAVKRRRSDSRKGIRLKADEKEFVDELVTRLVKKGQPLTHIYAEHKDELPMSLRSLYNYIDAGELTIRNIDLRRKTGYKPRKKKNGKDPVRELGFANQVFDYLERGLGLERFKRLFPVFLTDNGSEFMKVDELELTEDYEYRTKLFYCDPMASWQKAHIEKNHEYIRYVTPKGKTLTPYTQEDMTLLMNHINSTRRRSLGGKAPYELVDEHDEDMHALFSLLKMDFIPPDEVHLKPDLFTKNR